MTDSITEYYEALERLQKNKSVKVPVGSKINKDTVALEAGRKRGSIKKSRSGHEKLINAIESAVASQVHPENDIQLKYEKAKAKAKEYRQLWETALTRELSLLYELHELKK